MSAADSSSPDPVSQGLEDYAVITISPDGTIIDWNNGAETIFGYERSEIVGHPIDLLFTPEDRAADVVSVELSRAAHHPPAEDQRWHVRKDGSRIWLSGTVRAVRNESGELTGFTKIAREITSQKIEEIQRDAELAWTQRAHAQAERHWKELEEIFENLPAAAALVRMPDQVFVFANHMAREILGDRQLAGLSIREAMPEFDPGFSEILNAVVEAGRLYSASEQLVRLQNGDGISERYVDLTCQPMYSEAGKYEAVLIFAVDVTDRVLAREAATRLSKELEGERDRLRVEVEERKRAEELAKERQASLEEHASLLDLARDGIVALDAEGRIEFWNRGAEEMYGWSKQEAAGRNIHQLLGTKAPRPIEEIRKIVLTEGEWSGELRHRNRQGEELDVWTRWVARKRYGAPAGWLEIIWDLSERKRLEAHLREAQKLESLGVLAGGIAHDFNNILTGVIGNVSLALDIAEPPLRSLLKEALHASERAAFLTKQMLAYAGKGQFLITLADLSRVVRDSMPLVRSSIPDTADLILDLADGLPPIQADVSQLEQVTMNLVLNAAEAIGEAPGRITVRTGTRQIDTDAAATACDVGQLSPGHYVVLEVNDTGVGIDESVRSTIFDPFVTTKFTGRGLGLAAVSGIVRMLNGAIHVESALGRGSTFRVFFPAVTHQPVGQPQQVPEQRDSILVVDDQEIVRRTADTILSRCGYEVLLAETGQQALDLFHERSGRLSLVLLDMTMPGMSGEETFRKLKAMRPDVSVIVQSGYNEQEAIRRFGGLGIAGFIEKPYTPKVLIDKVEDVLKRSSHKQ